MISWQVRVLFTEAGVAGAYTLDEKGQLRLLFVEWVEGPHPIHHGGMHSENFEGLDLGY